jgi:hypothetical protein
VSSTTDDASTTELRLDAWFLLAREAFPSLSKNTSSIKAKQGTGNDHITINVMATPKFKQKRTNENGIMKPYV